MMGLGMIKLGATQNEDLTWSPVISLRMGSGQEVDFQGTFALATEAEAQEFCGYLYKQVFSKCSASPLTLISEDEVVN